MHDAHLGYALFFLDMLAEYTLLSMTVMVTPCHWYVVGMNLVCPMSKFPQAPFARAPFGESRSLKSPISQISSLQGSQKCCREFLAWNREWKSPWKMPWSFWWNFVFPLSSGNEARKCPECFTTSSRDFSPDLLQLQMPNFMAFFALQTIVLDRPEPLSFFNFGCVLFLGAGSSSRILVTQRSAENKGSCTKLPPAHAMQSCWSCKRCLRLHDWTALSPNIIGLAHLLTQQHHLCTIFLSVLAAELSACPSDYLTMEFCLWGPWPSPKPQNPGKLEVARKWLKSDFQGLPKQPWR